jgi:hypothetical protein
MELKAGGRLRSTVDATEVVVIRAPKEAVEVTCGGAAMVPPEAAGGDQGGGGVPASAGGEGAALGKRYVDEPAGLELLCTKGGTSPLACDGRALELKSAKPLPSSD